LRSEDSLSPSDGLGDTGSGSGGGMDLPEGLLRICAFGGVFRWDLRFLGREKKLNIFYCGIQKRVTKNYSTNGLFSLRYN
jgi:hypothetical protein